MMGWLAWTLTILTMVVGVILTIIVMMQNAKDGQSQAFGGNTFYGSNKGNTLDGMLSKLTIFFGLSFITLCFITTIAIIK